MLSDNQSRHHSKYRFADFPIISWFVSHPKGGMSDYRRSMIAGKFLEKFDYMYICLFISFSLFPIDFSEHGWL